MLYAYDRVLVSPLCSVNNIFFKLVLDIHGIYGGDLAAAKVPYIIHHTSYYDTVPSCELIVMCLIYLCRTAFLYVHVLELSMPSSFSRCVSGSVVYSHRYTGICLIYISHAFLVPCLPYQAAKQELRSLQSLINCHVPGLFFPMMSLIDYLGVRLVCVAVIPGGLRSQ